MEKEGTTKTFVVSTKIFVDAQSRRMQSEEILLCFPIRKASLSQQEMLLFMGFAMGEIGQPKKSGGRIDSRRGCEYVGLSQETS